MLHRLWYIAWNLWTEPFWDVPMTAVKIAKYFLQHFTFRSPSYELQSVYTAPYTYRARYRKMSEMWRGTNHAPHSCPMVEFGRCSYFSRCVAVRERSIPDPWSHQISRVFDITRARIIRKYKNSAFKILDSFHLVYQECSHTNLYPEQVGFSILT